ncbi:uncharacterized protein TrAtP1_007372 [Trichoderma atroviride]|uniref:uncharacterized protein n=1 Tax=Hypocrea atroviridis TaxID=63577 RepID=UPI003333DFF6|nr:hypothetical protein TrAtP1_007372 [Trichoderma atroviride]
MSPLGLMWRKVDIDLEGISEKVGRPDAWETSEPIFEASIGWKLPRYTVVVASGRTRGSSSTAEYSSSAAKSMSDLQVQIVGLLKKSGKDKFNPLIIDSDSDVEDDLTTARVEEQEARTTLEDSGRALDGAEMASSPLTEANEWLFASGNGDVTDLNSQIKKYQALHEAGEEE